jgi:hypothetical protein
MRRRFGTPAVALVILVGITVGACTTQRASNPPMAIGSVADIAGTWTGTLDFGGGEQFATLTIEPGGRASIVGRSMTAHGQVTARDGQATYDFPGRSDGAVRLYGIGAQRQLHLKGKSGVFEAWVTPGSAR